MGSYISSIPLMDVWVATTIILFVLLFRKQFTAYVFRSLLFVAKKARAHMITHVLLGFERPFRAFIVIAGLYVALLFLPYSLVTPEIVEAVYRSLVVILIGWGIYNIVSEHTTFFLRLSRKTDIDEDGMLVPFFSKVLRVAVVAVTLVIVLSEWEYDVTGIVAGVGLGGLAFTLAAKDMVRNFFGGIIIMTEKPLSKGNWIKTPSVEGVVEDITFRSTRIRTFADSLVTVPNTTLANEPITNWTRMGKCRVTFELKVVHETPRERLERVTRMIEELLSSHEGVDQDVITVRFRDITSSSLDIFVYFFTKTTDWDEWLAIKEDINFQIKDILEKESVKLAR